MDEKNAFVLLAELRAFLVERGILKRPLDVNVVEGGGTGLDYGPGDESAQRQAGCGQKSHQSNPQKFRGPTHTPLRRWIGHSCILDTRKIWVDVLQRRGVLGDLK